MWVLTRFANVCGHSAVCTRQLDMGRVALDIQGLLDDPSYVAETQELRSTRQNVSVLSINVTAALLAQYVSFSVSPGGLGDPGPIQYALSSHDLFHLKNLSTEGCLYEVAEPAGDFRQVLTGIHDAAKSARESGEKVPLHILAWRKFDNLLLRVILSGK